MSKRTKNSVSGAYVLLASLLCATVVVAFAVESKVQACTIDGQDPPESAGAYEASDPDVVYFVSVSDGVDTNPGTEALPFKSISGAAEKVRDDQAEDRTNGITRYYKIWVEAGEYKEEVNISLYGDPLGQNRTIKNLVIEGYQNNLGDVSDFDYTPGDQLDPSKMPLLQGSGELGSGVVMSFRGENIIVRNFQIENYQARGIQYYGAKKITLENIVVNSITHQNQPWQGDYGGVGMICRGNHCKVRHCIAVNCWGANITINGDFNEVEACESYCINPTDNGTDYYFIVAGECNKITDCNIERIIDEVPVPHGGHGYMAFHAKNNEFVRCVATGFSIEGIRVGSQHRDLAGSPHKGGFSIGNTFTDCEVHRSAIVLDTESTENRFVRCMVDGQGPEISGAGIGGVMVWHTNLDGEGRPGFGNVFEECTFRNQKTVIDFHYFSKPTGESDNEGGNDNMFSNCVFEDFYQLFETERPNSGTRFVDSVFSRILHYHAERSAPLGTPIITGSTFIDAGFELPPGNGNTELKTGEFPPVGDFRTGLVGHWKFDEITGTEVHDSSGNEHHGTLIDGDEDEWSSTGKLGGCIRLDGVDDYVSIPDSDNLDLVESDAITIAGWINFETMDPVAALVHKFGGGYSNYRLMVHYYGGFLTTQAGSGGVIGGVSSFLDIMEENRWYHVAVVLNSAEQKAQIYIDGILRASKAFTNARGNTSAPLLFGWNSWNSKFLNGWLDDWRIYDRALDIYDLKSLAEFRDPSSGLVGHWKFDELADGIAVDSAGSSDGILMGDASPDSQGKLGGCLRVNGSGYVQVPDNDVLDAVDSDAVSIATWVKADHWDPVAGLVHKFGSGYKNYRLMVHYNGAHLTTQAGSNGELGGVSVPPVELNSWHHLVVVYDSANEEVKFYVNGELRATEAFTIARGNTGAPLLIGRNSWNNKNFRGCIDDVRIYNRALDDRDVRTLVGYRDTSSGLVGHWKFDEIANGVAFDSANNSNGVLSNGLLMGDAIPDSQGKLGGCLRVNGSGYVQVPDNDVLDAVDSGAVSIATWVKADHWDPVAGLVHKFGSGYKNYRLMVHYNGAHLSTQAGSNGELGGVNVPPVELNSWHHLVAVYDSANEKVEFYVNGELRATKVFTIARGNTSAPLLIGRNSWNNKNFRGYIDDVRIYKRALNSEDVEALHQLP